MSVYTEIPLSTNLSQLIDALHARLEAIRGHERGTITPSILVPGMLWCKTDHAYSGGAATAFYWHNGAALAFMLDPRYAQLNAGGTVAAAANIPMGGNVLTGLGAGSANGQSVRYEQVLLRSGALAMTGDLDLGGHAITNFPAGGLPMGNKKITGLAAPAAADDAARKTDVDSAKGTWGTLTSSGSASVSAALGFTPSRVVVYLGSPASGESGTPVVHGDQPVNTDEDFYVPIATVNAGTGAVTSAGMKSRLKRTATGFDWDWLSIGGVRVNGKAMKFVAFP